MLDELGERCTAALAEHGCPSVSVAVAERGEVVLAEAYGAAELATGRRAGTDTVYPLGSVTKSITAVAVCVAADQGLLELDAPVPGEFGRWPAPTVRQLLQHRGGFGPYYDWDYGDGAPRIDPDRYAVLFREPGSGFEYANLGYRILGRLLESVTGLELGAFVRERVLLPLGLTHSRLTRTYPGPAPAAVRHAADGRGYPDYDCGHPGATLGWAPAGELALFAQTYHRLLKPRTAAAMRAALPINEQVGYGLGWCLAAGAGQLVQSHGGGGGGVAAMTVALPERRLSVAVLSNSTDKAARDAILRYVLGELAPGFQDAWINPMTPRPTRPMELPAGEWSGRISTPDGELPVELRTLTDGRIEVGVAGERAGAAAVSTDTWDLLASLPLQLPTADARVNSPQLMLGLRREAGGLVGMACANKDGEGDGRLGNFLSHHCELRPR
ncbi:serine hydrolase domain-containing protein [Kitasatospora sp. NPDC052896]|uniref:serine hydrolase domain-containing protein n=1 Tax=Kitasatospora sp. NPDC052896 TaxID=3364061 RepID=UPI0037CC917E